MALAGLQPIPGVSLRDVRRAADISLRDLQDLTGIHRATWSRIETGVMLPKPQHIAALSTALGVPYDEWRIRSLTKAGVEVYVARPRHLEQLGLILSARSVFTAPDDPLIPYRLSTDAARAARQQLLSELRKEIER